MGKQADQQIEGSNSYAQLLHRFDTATASHAATTAELQGLLDVANEKVATLNTELMEAQVENLNMMKNADHLVEDMKALKEQLGQRREVTNEVADAVGLQASQVGVP